MSRATTVYRFYNKTNGSHFYTASEAEKNIVLASLAEIYSWMERPSTWHRSPASVSQYS